MKRKIFVLLTALALVAGLAACGSKSNDGTKGSDSGAAESSAASSDSVETVNVGDFSVDVPSNYYVMEMLDFTADVDDEGNYPTDPSSIGLTKDATSEADVWSKPTIYIYYYDDSSAEDGREYAEYVYSDITDFDYSVNGKECIAFEGTIDYGESDEDPYVYSMIYIPIDDSTCFYVNIPKSVNEMSLDVNDAQVQAILDSVVLN